MRTALTTKHRITTDWRTTEFESFGRIILIALDGDCRYDTTLKLESISPVQSVAASQEPTTIRRHRESPGLPLLRRGRKS
jgi:hypothetical protein